MKPFRYLIIILTFTFLLAACGPAVVNITENTLEPTPDLPTPLPPEPTFDFPSTEGELVYSSDQNGLWQVMLMNADGSNQISLTEQYGEYSSPAWSPDGMHLAMRIDFGTGSGIATMDVQGSVGSVITSQPAAITDVFSDAPDWSPDGSQLVFMSSGDFGWDLIRYSTSTSATFQIPGIPAWVRDPKWSPDGQKILYSADIENNGNSDIFVANVDGSNITQLTFNTFYEGSPAWSPDGQQIIFSADANNNLDLFIMNQDGSGLVQLTDDPADEFDASWSPDGTRIAFVSTRHDNNFSNNYEIYIINSDGSREMRLTNNSSNDRWPEWRPGSTSSGQGNCRAEAALSADVTIQPGTVFLAPISATKIWRLENTGQCTFTPDAFRLRFVSGELMSAPVSIPIPGAIQPGSSVEISAQFTSPASAGIHEGIWQLLDASDMPVVDATGNPLELKINISVMESNTNLLPAPVFFLRGEGTSSQIWRMETDGLNMNQLTQESGGVSNFEINPLNNNLAYVVGQQLILLDPVSGTREVLVQGTESDPPRRPIFSPDGNSLAYSLGGVHVIDLTTKQDRLILANNQNISPSQFRRYSPRSWSPDGSKLALSIGYYEWGGSGILSTTDGTLLSEFDYADTQTWSLDSMTYFTAHASEPGMISSIPGLNYISATLDATENVLIEDSFIWWPFMKQDGNLVFFQGEPDVSISGNYNISLMSGTGSNGPWQVLWPDLLHLTANGFPEAAWLSDGRVVAVRLFHNITKTNEVLLLRLDGSPPVFLLQEGVNIRFGK